MPGVDLSLPSSELRSEKTTFSAQNRTAAIMLVVMKLLECAQYHAAIIRSCVLLCFSGVAQGAPAEQATARGDSRPGYQWAAPGKHDRDGIGKFYMGREIAQVMGHQGIEWLERPERVEEERTDKLIELLPLKKGDHVADVGAGSGYFSWRLAEKVGATGKVYAVDIQPEMLHAIRTNMLQRRISNVVACLGKIDDVVLPPGSIDLALMVDVYHEFSHPYEMLESICRALKKGGKVVFVEYRAEDPEVPIKPVHKMSEAQVKREAAVHPLKWVETVGGLPRQHLIVFERR